MLDRSVVAPEWKDEQDYSTATVPVSTFDDSCEMQVYPRTENSESSLSMVFVSDDLDVLPNQVLIQQIRYESETIAQANFNRVAREALDIFGLMMLTQPFAADGFDQETSIRKYGLVANNGASKAMHIELRGDLIFLVRAARFDDPPWDFIDQWVETAASVTLDEGTEITKDRVWRPIYGPIDFHPSVYEAPACT
jgi:hypothetical protein